MVIREWCLNDWVLDVNTVDIIVRWKEKFFKDIDIDEEELQSIFLSMAKMYMEKELVDDISNCVTKDGTFYFRQFDKVNES